MDILYKSAKGKKEIFDLYNQKLESLNIQYESLYVDTQYGDTHVIKTGDSSNPPLLLIHGSNACAPVALECYPNLASKYQVFAVDVLAQPNRSAQNRLSMKDDSYSIWINDVMEKLNIHDVTLVGFSFGGLIILKTLVHNASTIKEAVVASPAYIVNGNPLKAILQIFIPMRLYMLTHKPKYVEKFLSALFTSRDEFAMQFISKAITHFKMDFTPVPIIHTNEALKITTPLSIFAAKDDLLFPGKKLLRRAQNIISSLKHTELLSESKHVQGKEGNSIVEKYILKLNE